MYQNRFLDNLKYKKEIDSYRPLPKDIFKQIKAYYKIGLTYSSNALEGNTIDLIETKVILEDGLTICGKPTRDYLETLGHGDAYDTLFDFIQNQTITEENIKKLHKLFYSRIDLENAGQYRNKNVVVIGAEIDFPDKSKVPSRMKDFCQNISKIKNELNPIEFACKVHIDFVNIHPFIDGNGRVARLLLNLILLQQGFNITIIPPVLRMDYIRTIQETNKGNYIPFYNFISEMVLESQKEYLKIIKKLI